MHRAHVGHGTSQASDPDQMSHPNSSQGPQPARKLRVSPYPENRNSLFYYVKLSRALPLTFSFHFIHHLKVSQTRLPPSCSPLLFSLPSFVAATDDGGYILISPGLSLLSKTRIMSKACSCAKASIDMAPAGPAPMMAILLILDIDVSCRLPPTARISKDVAAAEK